MRKNSLIVRLLALLLALMLCGCGTAAVSPDPAPEEPAQPLPEASVPEEPSQPEEPVEPQTATPLPNGWTAEEFTVAGFDKEGPGDFGYQTELTEQEQADLVNLLETDSWQLLDPDFPGMGFVGQLVLADHDLTKFMWVMGSEDMGTFISLSEQDGETVVYTAPAEVLQEAKRFARRLRMRDYDIPDMNPAQQELFDAYLFPWALQTPFDQNWDDPVQAAESMVFYLLLGGCCQLEYGSMEPMNQYETEGNGMPAEFVEQTLLAHFDLPLEWIRNHKEYDSEANVYHFVSGYGGVGNVGAVTGSRQNGDLLEIDCSWFDWRDGEAPDLLTYSHTVTIKLEEDGGWKYVGNRITWRLNDQT